ncbi:putative late blight resistance protein homolog R1B-16 [Primulina eburnea]|uniref:putative late blight resistance protein homolog R1B-16 n=1 Tax=Primulina eburnea TaxID=1245227 RepID=UPI003C6CA680
MGGIGKTTLVKSAFQDESIPHYFDVAAWVTVSENYRERDILLGLLESMRRLTTEMHQESDEDLSECLYKSLKGKRYLIVMDDMWHKEAWENIKRLFPDDNMGSRVLLTTRLSDVAAYANSSCHEHHLMRLLNENESWNLLSFKVFGDEESCPTELQEAGKKIAFSCKGLPLSVVVISGLLSKVPRTREEWESIAKNLNSFLIADDGQCTELLSLSYDHLPHHLKACFLYTGVFPLDLEIPISNLIKLWIAEGLIKPDSSMSLEEVAEEYFHDLLSRNLVLVGERRLNGKIKTCVIHDLLKDWCLSKAVKEKFSHTLNANIYCCQEIIKDPRRLCIRKDSSGGAGADILRTIGTSPLLRSLLSWSNPHDELRCCKLLRVLDLSKVDLEDFPSLILDLIHLRYVFIRCEQRDIYISAHLPDALRNLQTLIISQNWIPKYSSVRLHPRFWSLPHLRHIQFGTCYFPCPQEGDENSVLENLQTLLYVSSSSCTEEFIKRIPNVKKLGIRVDQRKDFPLEHLVNLHKLETLKCIVESRSHVAISKELTLPLYLKKLTLKGTRIPWTYMSIVGSLPNLEVLKLKEDAFRGSEWDSIEGEFCQLTSLLIEGTDLQHWRADKDHFPRLQRLTIWECANLEEIPPDIGNIPTLQSIELDDASPSAAESAWQIKEEQELIGNEELQVWVHDLWKYIYPKRKEKEKEAERRRQEAMEKKRKERDDRRREAEDRMRKQEAEFYGKLRQLRRGRKEI